MNCNTTHYRANSSSVPGDPTIAGDGTLTSDPEALYGTAGPDAPSDKRNGTGAIRAFGEHKGSGLALMCELLGGALTGGGTAGPGQRPFSNGMLSIYLKVDAFDAESFFAREVASYVEFVKSAKPTTADGEVLMPGEPERRTAAKREAEGVPLPDEAWEGILRAARGVGLDPGRIEQLTA